MRNRKHTGWKVVVDDHSAPYVHDADGEIVCDCSASTLPPAACTANMQKIAMLPDLIRLVKDLHEFCYGIVCDRCNQDECNGEGAVRTGCPVDLARRILMGLGELEPDAEDNE